MEPSDLLLSPSEKRTLHRLAQGEFYPGELDWVALQRLKVLGLAEGTTRVTITDQGKLALRRLTSGD